MFVIDTGVSPDDPDFGGRLIAAADFVKKVGGIYLVKLE